MQKSDSVFLLINSMSKAEKWHFKTNSAKRASREKKDYLRLFDAMAAQKKYDEKAIREKFKGELNFKHFRAIKLYLGKQIMKSLKNFYSEASIEMELYGYLAEIEILYRKELFEICINTVRKAKALARKYEKLALLLKISEWEVKLSGMDANLQKFELLSGDEKQKEENQLIDNYSEVIQLRWLFLKSAKTALELGSARTVADESAYDFINKFAIINKEAKSFQGEYYRLGIKMQFAAFKNDIDNVYQLLNSSIQLYEANPAQIEGQINHYVYELIRLAYTSIAVNKYTATGALIEKIKKIVANPKNKIIIKNRIDFSLVQAQLALSRGNLAAALELTGKIDSLYITDFRELDILEKSDYYGMQFVIHFMKNDYKKAQYYNQKVIDMGSDIPLNLQSSARIINLVLQYEQEEYYHLGFVLRSTYRFLIKNNRNLAPEVIVLNFLRNAMKLHSQKDLLEGLAKFKEDISPFVGKESFMSGFYLIEWIDSKLQKRPVINIINEKYLKAVAEEAVEEPAIL